MRTPKLLLALIALTFAGQAMAQTVDEIVDKHIAALGGKDKISQVKTLIIDRTMSVRGMDIPSKTTMKVGQAVRSESTVMGNSMIQVLDGDKGWMIRPAMMGGTGEPEEMPADMVKQMKGQLDPFGPLVNYKEKGNTVVLVGHETIDKHDNFHLKVTTKDGQAVDQYIDASTYLLTKSSMPMNGQTGEIVFSDYEAVDGIQFASDMDMTAGAMGTMNFSTDKIKINPPVDDSVFKKPAK